MGAFSFNCEHSLVHKGGFKEDAFKREKERERDSLVYIVYRFE